MSLFQQLDKIFQDSKFQENICIISFECIKNFLRKEFKKLLELYIF